MQPGLRERIERHTSDRCQNSQQCAVISCVQGPENEMREDEGESERPKSQDRTKGKEVTCRLCFEVVIC